MANWVYIKLEPNLFTVGFYDPKGKWQPESDHDTSDAAARSLPEWSRIGSIVVGCKPQKGQQKWEH